MAPPVEQPVTDTAAEELASQRRLPPGWPPSRRSISNPLSTRITSLAVAGSTPEMKRVSDRNSDHTTTPHICAYRGGKGLANGPGSGALHGSF